MDRSVLVFPVKPGTTFEKADQISAMFRSRPEEYRESRARLRITLERVYHQPTPMGDFVVVYGEGEGSAAETLGKMVASELSIDQDFVRLAAEIHGIDLTSPPAGPPPETIGDWTDPDAPATRGKGLAFCVPVIPGAEDLGRRFAEEAFRTRRDEMTASRRALNHQSVEVVTLHQTPHGAITGVYIEGPDPVEGNRLFAVSTSPFDTWFKSQLKTIYPPEIDFNEPLPGITEMFDSETVPK